VSLWLSTDIFKLLRNLVATYTGSSWSSLEISTIVVVSYLPTRKCSVLESKERTQSGRKGQRYSKLSPELKAEIGRQAAEHGVAATVRLYAKRLPAMGVVNLKLEVGGASTTRRSSKIKSRKV